MKGLAIAAMAVGFCAAAEAQETPAASWVDEVLPQDATPPKAIGVHNCLGYYPAIAKLAQAEGRTGLAYHIAPDGKVVNVVVRRPSGNPALDRAAVVCVKFWHYEPATQDGEPIDIEWRYDVKWVIAPSEPNAGGQADIAPTSLPFTPPSPLGAPHICTDAYPPDAVAERSEGSIYVGYTVAATGHTQNVRILQSSGYASLDDATVKCVRRWMYVPAQRNGVPQSVNGDTRIDWKLP